jgi:hypothetical protein
MPQHPSQFRDDRDRRASERFPCHPETTCEVTEPETGQVRPAAVWNVSAGGISLLLSPRFEPGRVLTAELRNAARAFSCRTTLEVRYSGICFPNGAWLHGCAFGCPLGEEDLQALI